MAQGSSPGASPAVPKGIPRFFMAFQAPGYRWLWLSGVFGGIAFVMESMARGWLVLQMTDSPLWVGVTTALTGATHFVFSIIGGAIADRVNRRKLLVSVQAITSVMALGLALLILFEAIRLWHILAFSMLQGVVVSVNQPARSSLTYDMVGPSRMLNATAFNFMASSLMRILGALAGGFIIDRLGVGQNYLVGVVAHLLAMTCLLAFRSPPNPIPRSKESFVQTLKGGLYYASRTRHVRQLLVLSLITEIFGFSYQHMMPVMARDVLKVGATGFGYLSAMGGVGQLAAMLVLVSLGDFQKKGWLLLGCAFGFGLFILLFALSPWLLVSLALVAVVAGMGSTYDSTMATVVQTTVSADMRGRVMGLLVATFGLNQVGGLGSGAIGTLLTVPIALAIGGGVVASNALRLVGMARQFNPSAQDRREPASPTS